MSGKQWSIAKRSLFEPFLSYCLSSLPLLPINVDSIAAPYEYSIHIFQKWFPTFSMSDRVVWPIWYLFLKRTFTCRNNIYNIFAIKSSAIMKKQSMLVCFGMLPDKSTHPQVQRASTNHLVPNLCWIGPLGSDGTVSGCRQKSSEIHLLCKRFSFTLLITLYQNITVSRLMVKIFKVLSFCPKRKCTEWRFWMRRD